MQPFGPEAAAAMLRDWEWGVRRQFTAAVARHWRIKVLQQQRANRFAYTRPGAALHEAGHAVLLALSGAQVRGVRIWAEWHYEQIAWFGLVEGYPWPIERAELPQNDIKRARCLLAGPLAERLFDPDFREGTCAHEIAESCAFVVVAALRLKCEPVRLWRETILATVAQLREHEGAVREIADVLLKQGSASARH